MRVLCAVLYFRAEYAHTGLAGGTEDRTEVYDVMDPVGEDPRWDVFSDLHDYLLQAFPLTYANALLLAVNFYDNVKQPRHALADEGQYLRPRLCLAWIHRYAQTSASHRSSRS